MKFNRRSPQFNLKRSAEIFQKKKKEVCSNILQNDSEQVDNDACRRTEQGIKTIMHEPFIFFTPTTDWIDKSDSLQSRSDFEQGWRATKKARLDYKLAMQVLEYKVVLVKGST